MLNKRNFVLLAFLSSLFVYTSCIESNKTLGSQQFLIFLFFLNDLKVERFKAKQISKMLLKYVLPLCHVNMHINLHTALIKTIRLFKKYVDTS